jgi:hypothetical protein
MAINPVRFAHAVCDEFLRYLFSAFPLSDPHLAEQAKKLLRRPSSLDTPLVQGPFLSLSEAFARGEPVADLATRGLLHPAMPGLIGYPTMWSHQQQVFEAIGRGEHVLVATGTGSGKTEAFLYPIVDDLLRQRDAGIHRGLTAVLVYPMNALANDQLGRLREMLGGTGVTFAQWVGTTPDKNSDVTVERFDGSSRQAYLAELDRRRDEARREDRAVRPLAPPEECCSEEDIRARRPRILLTNYRQLEVLLTRPRDIELFAGSPLKYLVFDEAHTYSGATGAEVACLIRRLRVLAGKSADEVVCVGTSATLSDPTKREGDHGETARRFASRFFGIDPARVTVVGEEYVPRDWPDHRYRPLAPRGDGVDRLSRILEAVTEPVDLDQVKRVVEELTGQIFDPGEDWQAALFRHLVANEYVYQASQILARPKRLNEAAWQTSQRLSPGRLPEGEEASAELLAYLILGAAARKGSESLLRPKVHFFVRGLDEMVVAIDGTPEAVRADLYMSLSHAKENAGGRHDYAYFPVLTCRNCGQHFFEKHYAELGFDRGAGNRLKGFEAGQAVDGGNAVWSTAPPGDDATRVLLTNRLLEEAESGGETKSSRWPRAWFCRACGAMHRDRSGQCLAPGCGANQPLLPLLVFGDELRTCPSCNTPAMRVGGRVIEPAKRLRAVDVADVHILAQAMINAAPDGHRKLIVFADSRQDAAFQAGWMQDHARRIRLRHMMDQVIEAASGPLPLDEITDRLMETFRRDPTLIDQLLPELTGEEAPAVFGSNKWVPVHRALRYMVLREFTTGIRRRDCLESMGLVRVRYDGLDDSHAGIKQWGETVGISPNEAVNAVSLLLDIWRRNRYLAVSGDAIFSRFHAKDDPYLQAGLLPLRDFRPEGLLLHSGSADKYARGLVADKGQTAVQALLRRWAADPEHLDRDAAIEDLWKVLTGEGGWLTKVELRSHKDRPLAVVWQVDAEKVGIEANRSRQRCTTCQRIMTRPAPKAACTRHLCPGTTVAEQPDPENYDVWLMGRRFEMVSAEEHTAQVPGEIRNRIENDFKSRQGRTNCLVATPTLEMGVNIGALDMALMRNVPPQPANYWQRAGRAGREERMAVVVTYCRRTPHDRYFFDDPLRLLGGAIDAPTFNLNNPVMVAKHIRSAVLSELILRSRKDDLLGRRVREVLATSFPHFIRDFLLDGESRFRAGPPSQAPLRAIVEDLEGELTQRLTNLFGAHWPEEAADLASAKAVRTAILAMPDDLAAVLLRLHRKLEWALKTRTALYDKKTQGLIDREDEQLLRRCDESINAIVRREASTYALTVLANEGFLPGYGVYDGGITASARRTGMTRLSGPATFDLQRASVVALREYVPGNRLYANRGSYYVARYHLTPGEDEGHQTLFVDPEQGIVTDASGNTVYGQSGAVEVAALPLTVSVRRTASCMPW